MALVRIPAKLREKFSIEEREHAVSILKYDFPSEWKDILDLLDNFWLTKEMVVAPGGNKSSISTTIDRFLQQRGWAERGFDTKLVVDGVRYPAQRTKLTISKTASALRSSGTIKPLINRALNNFRLLRQLKTLSVGVIITRMTELQKIFRDAGQKTAKGEATTHWDKLIPKVNGVGFGYTPLLLIALGDACSCAASRAS